MKSLLLAILLVVAAGGAEAAKELVGRLDVAGPNGFLNGKRAAKNTPVYVGDRVSTGPATSVKVLLSGGGYVQLDQNTDPDFLKEGGCLIVQILSGRVFIDGTGVCVATPSIAARQASQVHYTVLRGKTETVVLAGNVSMRRPKAVTLTRYDYYAVSGNDAGPPRKLTPQAATATAAWRAKWDFK